MRRRLTILMTLVAALALTVTGCGGTDGDDDTGIAAADRPSSSTEGSTDEEPAESETPLSEEEREDIALSHAQCMRDNGVESFPDPESSGGTKIDPETMNDPDREAAEAACEEYRDQLRAEPPEGRDGDEMMANRLAMAECMRENGVESFPDPQPPGSAERGEVLDQDVAEDPDFDTAMEECRDLLGEQGVIGGGPGAGGPGGGGEGGEG